MLCRRYVESPREINDSDNAPKDTSVVFNSDLANQYNDARLSECTAPSYRS